MEKVDQPIPEKAKKFNLASLWQQLVIPLLAVFTAMIVGGLVIAVAGGDPFAAYLGLFEGAFGSAKAGVRRSFGLLLTFLLGWLSQWPSRVACSILAQKVSWLLALSPLPGSVTHCLTCWALQSPPVIHLPLTLLAGGMAGMIWGAIPAGLKARFGGHEVINTIMMNYIALNLTSFLLNGPMKDPNPLNVIARTPEIAESARIPPIFAWAAYSLGFCSGAAGRRPGLVAALENHPRF